MIKAVILDMYGVIIKQSGDELQSYIRERIPGVSSERIWELWFAADRGDTDSLEIWRGVGFKGDLEEVEREYLDRFELREGVREFLSKVCGNYKTGLISNDPSRWSKFVRDKFDLNKYFDVICVSGDMHMEKPDPRIYQAAIEGVGAEPSECLFVDDRPEYTEGARRVGMNAVLMHEEDVGFGEPRVESFEALYEFLKNYEVR